MFYSKRCILQRLSGSESDMFFMTDGLLQTLKPQHSRLQPRTGPASLVPGLRGVLRQYVGEYGHITSTNLKTIPRNDPLIETRSPSKALRVSRTSLQWKQLKQMLCGTFHTFQLVHNCIWFLDSTAPFILCRASGQLLSETSHF